MQLSFSATEAMNTSECDEFNYDLLVSKDRISIQVVPEKKGLILKHVEYDINSQVNID